MNHNKDRVVLVVTRLSIKLTIRTCVYEKDGVTLLLELEIGQRQEKWLI